MTEADQMRAFAPDSVRPELKPYLKTEKLEGHTDKARNQCIVTAADTALFEIWY